MTRVVVTSERGSSLLAVIGLMAVAAIATLAIAGSTMNSLGVSSAARAGVQAQAAAEAGIDDALANLSQPICTEEWGTTTPVSTVDVFYSLYPTPAAGEPDTNWPTGCPPTNAERVKIVSIGEATQAGQAGNTTGDKRKVEAVYNYDVATSAITGPASALYSYSMGSFAGSSQLHAGSGEKPVVQVKTGDVVCDITDEANSAIFEADLVVADGAVTIGASCQIQGSVWASKSVSMSVGAQITGNVVAPSVKFIKSSIVHGSVWTSGATVLETSAWIKGSVTAGSLSMINSAKIDQDAWSDGTTTIGHTSNVITGHLTTKSLTNSGPGTITGGSTILPDGPARSTGTGVGSFPAVTPLVPDWVDVGYKTSLWEGFDVVKADGCGFFKMDHQIQLFKKSTIIDARDCVGGVVLSPENGSVKLKIPKDVDVVIYADKFSVLGDAVISGKGENNKLWLITPDETVGDGPTCDYTSGTGDTAIMDSFIVEASVAAFVYTPCALTMGKSHVDTAMWNGQFYGGVVSTAGPSQLTFDAIGIPNTGLSTGATSGSGPTDAKLGARISIRDVIVREDG